MIVVAIIGILAAVAIPAFINYMKKAKTTEAEIALGKIHTGAKSFFEEERATSPTASGAFAYFLPAVATTMPATPCAPNKCTPGSFVTNAAWDYLKFSMTENFWYSYAWTHTCAGIGAAAFYQQCAATNTFTITANGDLDNDGTLSTFQRGGQILTTVGAELGMASSGALYKVSELE
jgi:type IV pilus assembly protein PilA